MYKQKIEINDIVDWRIIGNQLWHKTRNENYNLIERDLSSLNVLWNSGKNSIVHYLISNEWIILNSDINNDTFIYNNKNRDDYFSLQYLFSFNASLLNGKFLLGNSRKMSYSVNIQTKGVHEHLKEDYSFYLLKDNYAICQNKDKNVISSRDIENNLKLVWLFDISHFGTYHDVIDGEQAREIHNTYLYKDKIIVAISRAVIALDFKTGELIWKLDLNDEDPMELLIRDTTAYMSVGVHYKVIDLEKGELIFERRTPTLYFEDKKLIYNNDNPGAIINWHNNKMWSLFNWNRQRYLASFAPESLELQSLQPLPVYDQHRQPVFDGNRLYVLQDCGTLLVFEEE